MYPFLEWTEERRNHVELVSIQAVWFTSITVLLLVLSQRREVVELVPLNLTNFFPGSRLEMGVLRHRSEDV